MGSVAEDSPDTVGGLKREGPGIVSTIWGWSQPARGSCGALSGATTSGGNNTQYLQVQGQILAQYDSGTWGYVLPDHLGSVRTETDALGQVTVARSFDPFGVPLQADGGNPFGYTGEQQDAGTGLVFLRARYYQPNTGRFLTRDPWPGGDLRPQSMNGWSYVEGNPVNWVDPTGYQTECDEHGYCPEIDRYLCGPNTPGGYDYRGLPCIVNPENVQMGNAPAPTQPTTTLSCVPTNPTDESWKFCQDDRDLTNWLFRELKDAATLNPDVKLLREQWQTSMPDTPAKGSALYGWASLVADGARWDFKDRIFDEFESMTILFRQNDQTPLYSEYSVPGNIFYAYVGSAIGFSTWWIHAGASYAEVGDPAHVNDEYYYATSVCNFKLGAYVNPTWIPTLLDDPNDYRTIEFGIHLWNTYHEGLTESQLRAEIEQKYHTLTPPPMDPNRKSYGWRNWRGTWPYPLGYFNGSKPSLMFPKH